MSQKLKSSTDASISREYLFLGYVLFDARGVHLLRRAKGLRIKNQSQKPDIQMVEAKAVELSLSDLRLRGWLPGMIEIDNLAVVKMLKRKIMQPNQKKLEHIIDRCKAIINPNRIQVCWKPRPCNKVADQLVEFVKITKRDIFDNETDISDTDLSLKLYQITWDMMFGAFRPYFSKSENISHGRHKYVFSTIPSWIAMAFSRERIPNQIILEVSTRNGNGVLLVERYLMLINTSPNKKVSNSSEAQKDEVIHKLIDVSNHLLSIPIPRTLQMYLKFDAEIELLENDLFKSCSSEDLMMTSHPRPFFCSLGQLQFGILDVTLQVVSYYDPGICIRRLKFGLGKIFKGKDISKTVLGWLHQRTIEDFKIIDILNEVESKSVENIEATLKELVQKGILIEKKPDLYIIQRKQLPQPSQNDFSVEDLEDVRKKDGECIAYYYKLVQGINV